MNIPTFVDSVIIGIQGGIRTTESKFSAAAIVDNLWECRAVQIGNVYKKSSRINPVWTQPYYPDFDDALQDEKNVIKYKIPAVVQMDEFTLGFMYIGSVDCLNQYRLFRSRAEYANSRRHRVQKTSEVPVAIYSDHILEIHNTKTNKIELRTDSVFQRPTDLPTFNYEKSDIPLDDNNLSIVRQMIIQTLLGTESKTPTKFKQTNTDITAQ